MYWSSICFIEHEVHDVLTFEEIQVICYFNPLFYSVDNFDETCLISCVYRVMPASMNEPLKLKLKVPSVTIVPDGGIPLRFIPREE